MTANSDGTAGNGASFQYRPATNGVSANSDSTAVVTPPYWVKIERLGDTLTGCTPPTARRGGRWASPRRLR